MKAMVSAVPNSMLLKTVNTVSEEKNIISNIIAKNRNGFDISQKMIESPYHIALPIPVKSQAPTLVYIGGCEKR